MAATPIIWMNTSSRCQTSSTKYRFWYRRSTAVSQTGSYSSAELSEMLSRFVNNPPFTGVGPPVMSEPDR